ncbi:hypothetical protein A1359_05805 [Methylomonas lenta]|uniref:Uncharacterized protein n=1 Tax=Methylomonas lenta TaxID=980561 RepID=A0A177NHT5_9GAMM|nr:hypothetical protein [Methylomonas lenta]OAI17608.1 hypothetical protein A1359_05805 [Methylomonas lenta]
MTRPSRDNGRTQSGRTCILVYKVKTEEEIARSQELAKQQLKEKESAHAKRIAVLSAKIKKAEKERKEANELRYKEDVKATARFLQDVENEREIIRSSHYK